MSCIRISRGIVCTGGPQRKIVDENGKQWDFEMHHYSGPIPTNAQGDSIKEPGPKSSFWRVVTWWAQQGQKVGDDGLCVWKKPPQPKVEHIIGRHYRIVGWEEAAS